MVEKNIVNMKEEVLKETELVIAGRKELEKIEKEIDDVNKKYGWYIYLSKESEYIFNDKINNSIQFTSLFKNFYRTTDFHKYDEEEKLLKQIEKICDWVIEEEIEFFKSVFETKKTKNRKYIKTDYYMGKGYDWQKIRLGNISSVTNKIYGILGKLPVETKKEDIEGVLDWGEKIKANDMIFKFYKNGRLDIEFLNDEDFEKIENVLQEA